MSSLEVEQLIRKLPKVEQHVHIVGATRPETLLWLAEEGGLDKPFKTPKDAQRFFQYKSLHAIPFLY